MEGAEKMLGDGREGPTGRRYRYPHAPVVQGSARGDPWAAEVPWNIHQHPRISHNR